MRPPGITGGITILIDIPMPPTLAGFNEAAGYHRRNLPTGTGQRLRRIDASMRPPGITGGISVSLSILFHASMGFNEAAGYHRRNPESRIAGAPAGLPDRFNEAAGYHRRNPPRSNSYSGR